MKSIILSSVALLLTFKAIQAEDRYLVHLNDAQIEGFQTDEKYNQPSPPRPYAFGYAAGRYPGHIDRTHSEISDGSGVVQGSYSYVDPRHKIRKVEYTADKDGFHPISNDNVPDLPSDTPVVAAAKANHLQKYAAIVQEQFAPNHVIVPSDTPEVQYAKHKHLALFEKIAAEHAQLAAELEAKNQEDKNQNEINLGAQHYAY